MEINLSKKALSISSSPTLAITAKAKDLNKKGINVIGFGAGEPDFDTPQHIKDAAIKAIEQGFTKYTPAAGTLELRQSVCNKLKRENNINYKSEEIVISNGAKHSLINSFTAICNPGDEVIIPAPYWVSYPEMVKLADGLPVFINTDESHDFKLNIEKLKENITPKTRAIVINSPCNPTGTVYSEKELYSIAELAVNNNIYIVSDEIYEHLIYGDIKHVSIASFGEEIKDITITVNGLSKTYSMTGWRIGYTASNVKIAKAMSNIQSHATSNPNSIAQMAAITALEGGLEPIMPMKQAFEQRKEYMFKRINSIEGLSCLNPQGAFYIMVNIKKLFGKKIKGRTINNSMDFADVMLDEANVALVPGIGFGAEGYVRMSYATSMENIVEGLDRIQNAIEV